MQLERFAVTVEISRWACHRADRMTPLDGSVVRKMFTYTSKSLQTAVDQDIRLPFPICMLGILMSTPRGVGNGGTETQCGPRYTVFGAEEACMSEAEHTGNGTGYGTRRLSRGDM